MAKKSKKFPEEVYGTKAGILVLEATLEDLEGNYGLEDGNEVAVYKLVGVKKVKVQRVTLV